MDNSKLTKRIEMLQKVSLGIVVLYFASKYILKIERAYSLILIVPLFGVILYRHYLQYKLTGDKRKFMLLGVGLLVASVLGAYFYFKTN